MDEKTEIYAENVLRRLGEYTDILKNPVGISLTSQHAITIIHELMEIIEDLESQLEAWEHGL